jgi:hypothetical protein
MPIHHSPFTVEAIELKYGKVKVFALLGCYTALIGSYRLLGQPISTLFKGILGP